MQKRSPLESLRRRTVRVWGLGLHVRGKGPSEGKDPHAAGRGSRAINKTVHAQSKWLIVENNSEFPTRRARVQKSAKGRVNKISPSASGLFQ